MLVNLRAPLLLALLVVGRCGAAPDGFELTRTAQPTSPSASDVAVFNFTYGLPAGSSQRLDCTADGGTLPPNSSSTWWPQGVTVKIPVLLMACTTCRVPFVTARRLLATMSRAVRRALSTVASAAWAQLRSSSLALEPNLVSPRHRQPNWSSELLAHRFPTRCAQEPTSSGIHSVRLRRILTSARSRRNQHGERYVHFARRMGDTGVLVHVEAMSKAGQPAAVLQKERLQLHI